MPSINVVFFASLRETLKSDGVSVELEQPLTVFELKQKLAQQLDQPVLLEDTVKTAIDYDFARDTDIIDIETVHEVAFFPPVTGG
ncbi:MoaD/ThiS family protein [Marinomonas ostreistagni]|uniref:MoaD/ThiS family protein n=1 Tax=Marinomonas ostreistagni TaxID=359209 RepID=UPI0019522B7E|nr:MoaD/ThiS family protein [Marinomonas ostreistagni]MBM6550226.1 MoaD/ThiS family protein [Marinomonas ostreistagni]